MSVYLLHFETKIAHAQHYLGFTDSLDDRIRKHKSGSNARLVAEFASRNIAFEVSRVWPDGDRKLERHLKDKYKRATSLCPICKQQRKAKRRIDVNAEVLI